MEAYSNTFVVSELGQLKEGGARAYEGFQDEEGAAFVAQLRACSKLKDLHRGAKIHKDVLRRGLLPKCSDALVTMYAKCSDLHKARMLLDMCQTRDMFTWTAVIAAYTQAGQAQNALDCFECMQGKGIRPDAVTYTCILNACAAMKAVEKGEELHEKIKRQGLLQNNVVLGNSLLDMYAKCGAVSKAQDVLENLPSRDVVSWNTLITGYVQEGHGEKAVDCFEHMQCEGIIPNAVTYICILKACASLEDAQKGKQIQGEIERQGLLQDNLVLGNALVDMYAKCGAVSEARGVLEELPARDVVSWSALIAGYAQEGHGRQALNCYECMLHDGILPNAVTYISVLKACTSIGALDKGKEIHDEVEKQGLLQDNVVLGTALVDMYAKCGALAKAQNTLEKLPSRNVVSWSTLIAGYAQEGQGEQALNCFDQMQREGITPNVVTYLSVLNVCSHMGLVEEGHAHFVDMSTKYGLEPDLDCFVCLVDLFGRAGHLERAVELIREMPSPSYSAVWLALLAACQKWGNVHVGRWAFEQAAQLDRSDGSAYVLMANIYVAAGLQENARNIEAMRIGYKHGRSQGVIIELTHINQRMPFL